MVDRDYFWFRRHTLVWTEILLAMVLAVYGDSLVQGNVSITVVTNSTLDLTIHWRGLPRSSIAQRPSAVRDQNDSG